jgi:hypothetical protein
VPHLLQYISSAVYYARVKLGGKLIRRNLETTVWTDAKLKLEVNLPMALVTPKDAKGPVPVHGELLLTPWRDRLRETAINGKAPQTAPQTASDTNSPC